jgi:hypothetical protein
MKLILVVIGVGIILAFGVIGYEIVVEYKTTDPCQNAWWEGHDKGVEDTYERAYHIATIEARQEQLILCGNGTWVYPWDMPRNCDCAGNGTLYFKEETCEWECSCYGEAYDYLVPLGEYFSNVDE